MDHGPRMVAPGDRRERMNPERYQRVKQVFLAACDVNPSQWVAFLDQACAGDQELRREVESLLTHHRTTTMVRQAAGQEGQQPTAQGRVPGATFGEAGESVGLRRFAAGEILAGRYRILGPLGRGGMGDVYRADDLRLGQSVALKFLAPGRSTVPAWLGRYRNEVRLAREVTHVNVLRVYDISEAEGEVFISMEYVDGEDLKSLLRRVGRLSGEKTIQVARQLCAGLGAAHDRGVLHRDLKPANVMIDGRGQVRIADFGIASLIAQPESTTPAAGTPAYMAPELFAGGSPSVRSDLFSLGVVLYETLTGKQPFERPAIGAPDRGPPAARPSAVVSDVDPALEKTILQCLEHEAKRRPASAYAVAAWLPGGDPLAAAAAAGQTPSPSMVAAGEAKWRLPQAAALGCLAAGTLALLLIVGLADRTFLLPQAGLAKPPAVLAERAEQVVAATGNTTDGQERTEGFAVDRGFVEHPPLDAERQDPAQSSALHAAAVYFWYRVGSEPIVLPTLLNEPIPSRVVPASPGAVTVRLDGSGRLLDFLAMPTGRLGANISPDPSDWAALFDFAGLRFSDFGATRPIGTPPRYVDDIVAWETSTGRAPTPIRVEGGSAGGRVVYFHVVRPWEQGQVAVLDDQPIRPDWPLPVVRWLLYLVGLLGGGFLAWRNIQVGRGDLRGASKLAACIMAAGVLDWLLGERHGRTFAVEAGLLYLWIARATLTAVVGWVSYLAVEPYVRRYWPDILITWTRVLNGKFRDPLVGRDLLIGATCGALLVLMLQLDVLLPSWLGRPASLPKLPGLPFDLGAVLGLRYKLNVVVVAMMVSITLGLIVLLMMLVLRVAIRHARLALLSAWLLLTVLQTVATGSDVAFPWAVSAISSAVIILLTTRVGLVATFTCLFVWSLLINSPMTSNLQAWYAPSSTLAAGFAAAILLFGVITVRAGHPQAHSQFWE